ncbi:amidohydrolase family protein [Pseudonocardia acaciae]|uniref:amidohydrolase family protein n=1 Tax=Pseudonocardia acaciae TaxID=551276 RepID=UPI000491D250|nr:amidohydrolase family protein [Pseudonocardia acaciae]
MSRPPFTDSHVHFFDLRAPELHYEWLRPGGDDEETEFLGDYSAMRAERYWADDFIAETRFQNVRRVIHVQAALGIDDPVEETRWLEAFRERLGVPHAIVAHVDLAAPDAGRTLQRHLAASPVVRGVRDLRYDGYLTDPAWEAGFALLGELGLVCCDDPLLEHVPAAAALAARHPEVTFCVDHALAPRRRDPEYFSAWREAIGAMAAVPTAVMKISGLGMGDHAWTVDSLRPWVLACIEAFGVERSFFGTNWPVDRIYSSYGDVLDAYAEIIADFSEDERRALFGENARRIFRIG